MDSHKGAADCFTLDQHYQHGIHPDEPNHPFPFLIAWNFQIETAIAKHFSGGISQVHVLLTSATSRSIRSGS